MAQSREEPTEKAKQKVQALALQYLKSFDELGKRIDRLEKMLFDNTEALGAMNSTLILFAELMARASESPKPVEFLFHLMREVMSRGERVRPGPRT